MHKIAKKVLHSLYILAILSLITPLSMNVMVKYDIMWKKSYEINYAQYEYSDYNYAISYPIDTIMNNSDEYYSLLRTDRYGSLFPIFSKTNDMKEWSNYTYIGYDTWPILDYGSIFDLAILNNRTLLLSAISNVDFHQNYTFNSMISKDGINWSSNLTIEKWDHPVFNAGFDIPQTKDFGIFEQDGEIKLFTLYILDNTSPAFDELGIAIWGINQTENMFIRESNFTIPVRSWRAEFWFNMEECCFLTKTNSSEGCLIFYKNNTWSTSKFEFTYQYTVLKPIRNEEKTYVIHRSRINPLWNREYLLISEIANIGINNTSTLLNTKAITKCDTLKYDGCFPYSIVKGSNSFKMILGMVLGSTYPSLDFILYEEGYDYSQVVKLSIGVAGLTILAIIPISFVKWKDTILGVLKKK